MDNVVVSEDGKYAQKTGMVLGEQHIFKCSNCDKELLETVVNYPQVDAQWNVVAECCFCGDRSYPHTIKGMFITGRVDGVHIIDIDYNSDPIVYKTVKAKP